MIFLALRDLQLKDISCLEFFFFKRNAWQQHLKMICFSLQNLICFQIIIQYNHIEQFILIYKPFFLQESKDMERKTNKADKGVPRMPIFSLVKVLVSQGVNLLEQTRLDLTSVLVFKT